MAKCKFVFRRHKSQLISVDAILAMVLFLFILISVAFSYNHAIMRVDETQRDFEISYRTNIAFMSLFHTGYPANWDRLAITNSSILHIGLTHGGVAFNHSKLAAFAQANESYYRLQNLLGLASDDFYVTFEVYEGSTFTEDSSLRVGRQNQSVQRVAVRSKVLPYNDTIGRLTLRVYDD